MLKIPEITTGYDLDADDLATAAVHLFKAADIVGDFVDGCHKERSDDEKTP